MFHYTCPCCQRSYELRKATTAEARTCNYCGHPIGPDEVLEQLEAQKRAKARWLQREREEVRRGQWLRVLVGLGFVGVLCAVIIAISSGSGSSKQAGVVQETKAFQLRKQDSEAKPRVDAEAKAKAERAAERSRPVPELRQSLRANNPQARARAAEVLAERGAAAAEAVPDLISALQDQDGAVRHQATIALGMIGSPAKAALSPLIQTVGDPDARIGQAAQQAIEKIGPDLPSLNTALQDKNLTVRQFVIKTMGKIGPDGKPAIPILLGLLQDQEVSAAAVEALQSIGPLSKTELPALVDALKIRDRAVRLFALAAIGRLAPDAKVAVPTLAAILSDTDDMVRSECLNTLEIIGPDAKAAIPSLVAAIKELDTARRLRAGEVLAAIGTFQATDALNDALKDKDPKIRLRAAVALRKLGPEAWPAVRPLIVALKDSDAEVRSTATEALAKIGKEAVPGLVETLQRDINSNVRIAVCLALGEIGPDAKDAGPALSSASTNDINVDVRKAAKEAAAKIPGKK